MQDLSFESNKGPPKICQIPPKNCYLIVCTLNKNKSPPIKVLEMR